MAKFTKILSIPQSILPIMNSPILSIVFLIFHFWAFTHSSMTTEDELFADCCKNVGIDEKIIKTACKYPPKVVKFGEKVKIAKHFSGFVKCYAAQLDNTECCKENKISGTCQAMCNGANPPKNPLEYTFCQKGKEDSEAINNCNHKGAEKVVKELMKGHGHGKE